MKKILSVIAAAMLGILPYHPANSEPQQSPVKEERWLVKNDGGGIVENFKIALRYMSQNKMPIKLSGYCASACTLLVSDEYKLDVCVTPDAKLGFHSPYAMDALGRTYHTIPLVVAAEKMWREEFYGKYPAWVKLYIDANGGAPSVLKGAKPNDVLWMEYKDLSQFMKTCL